MNFRKTRNRILKLKHIKSCEYFTYNNRVDFIARDLKDNRYGQGVDLLEQNGRDIEEIVVAKFNKII